MMANPKDPATALASTAETPLPHLAAMSATVRIQKYLSQAGACSRREAERLVAEGKVTVNGHVAQPGHAVRPGEDVVKIGRKVVAEPPRKVVLLMNKPRGYLCTNKDEFGGQTVFELVPPPWDKSRLFCVGRLDKDSEGLLLLTNDGDLANRVMHPSGGVIKRYEVQLNRAFDPELTPRLLKGVRDGEDFLRFRKVIQVEGSPDRLEIHLDQGRKREIRRLLEVFGFHVKTLRRFQVGELVLRKMPSGDCRLLSQKEVAMIFGK
jgi:23S rRNA pseudouridine2605 synthase